MALIGGFPATDEGFNAFWAQYAHATLAGGHGLPDAGTLQLYPILASWVFALDVNPLLALRGLDLLAAAAVALVMFRIAAHEARDARAGAVIAAFFAFAMAQFPFVQHGFKNAIVAAFVPLLAAAWLAVDERRRDQRPWLACGALAALGVLLREPLFPLFAVGAAAIASAHGARAAVRFLVGGVAAVGVVVGIVVALRGGLSGLLAAYSSSADFYAQMAGVRWTNLAAAFTIAARDAACALPLLLAAVVAGIVARDGRVRDARAAFWLAAAIAPWWEPVAKFGFAYHVAACLPGFCLFTAWAWGRAAERPRLRAGLAVLALVPAAWLAWKQAALIEHHYWPTTRANLAAFHDARWPKEAIARSNYLLMADAVRRATAEGGTLAVSGSYWALFPLTGRLPRRGDMADLTHAAVDAGLDAARLAEAIRACPPDTIVVTNRTGYPGQPALEAAMKALDGYALVETLAPDPLRDYGHFGGAIYARRGPTSASCRRP